MDDLYDSTRTEMTAGKREEDGRETGRKRRDGESQRKLTVKEEGEMQSRECVCVREREREEVRETERGRGRRRERERESDRVRERSGSILDFSLVAFPSVNSHLLAIIRSLVSICVRL